ncbi:MAG: serine/threonine protein kinase [Planctomycetes bacterium]|nr:serine/threonine protein kinase [Planctomycetota bacterium]
MTREHFAAIRELFHRAFELPERERTALLQRECVGRDDLRTAVEELLRAEQTASEHLNPDGGLIVRCLMTESANNRGDTALPEFIGPYRVRNLLGRGGMGEVYLAEQTNPRRDVALKVLHRGATRRSLFDRFSREIRALGRLEHPGIARIYEAGQVEHSDSRIPYFAMEFVSGQNLTEFARSQSLDLPSRLELVAKIADAVQHAHTKGVIHRDLKPSNILMATADVSKVGDAKGSRCETRTGFSGPQPKILDFGVARVLEPEVTESAATEAGLLIGTVAYMSPEQLNGDSAGVDARADVYAIGVILYELLTGRLPHEVRSKPLSEAALIVCEHDPAPLYRRGQTPLGPFDRDIQTIVARALTRDREQRYSTAAALCDDLRRYLRSEPVLARRPTVTYQLSKFARRNKGLVTGAAVALLALVAGLIASTVLYAREQEAHQRADAKERLSSAVQTYLVDGLLMAAAPERMGHEVKMLDVLTLAADGLEDRFADQPDVEATIRAELAEVLSKVGKFEESEAQFALAIPLMERVFGIDDPRTIRALLSRSSNAHQLKKLPASAQTANEALTRTRRSLPTGSDLEIAALQQLGATNIAQGRFKPAKAALHEALDLAQLAPDEHQAAIIAIQALIAVADGHRAAGDSESIGEIAEAAAVTLGPDNPTTINTRSNLLIRLNAAGKAAEAVAIAAELPASAERTFAPGHPMRGHVYRNSAESYRIAGQFEQAERLALMANDIFSQLQPEQLPEQEVCMAQMRAIYSQWPGHQDQLQSWSVNSIGARLKMALPGRWFTVRNTLQKVISDLATGGIQMTDCDLLASVWDSRDTFAPPGNKRRAMFFANFARAAAAAGDLSHHQEALAMAQAALSDAEKPNVVSRMIENAASQR